MRGGCGIALLLFFASASAADPIPAHDFARKAGYESAKISPKGDYLAVGTWVDDRLAMAVIDLKKMKVSTTLRFSAGQHVANFWWTKPDRLVAAVATWVGPLGQPALTGELYGINADGSNLKYLFGYRGQEKVGSRIPGATMEYAWAEMLDPLPYDPRSALIAAFSFFSGDDSNPTFYKLDVYSGTISKVGYLEAYDPVDVAADRNGTPRYAYGKDHESRYHGYIIKPGESDWKEVDYKNGRPTEVYDAWLSGDASSAFTITNQGGDRTCLEEIVLATGEIRRLSCNDAVNVYSATTSFDEARLPIAVDYEAGLPTLGYVQPDHPDARLLQTLHNSFPGQRVTVTSHTLDGSKVLLLVDSDRNPGDFYLFDRVAKNANYLFSRRQWIDPDRMQPMKPIEYKGRDGTVLHGYLTMPATEEQKKVPLVVLPHGGPVARDYWDWNPWVQFLASRGYAVLQPNYRGSSGYGHQFEVAGYKKWGTLMQDDIADATHWAVAQGIADGARVCIFGGSWGGYAALLNPEREPGLYRCSVDFAGVTDLPALLSYDRSLTNRMGRNYLADALGDDNKSLSEQSPVNFVDRLRVPVLIVHGVLDENVPLSQAKELRAALDQQKKPYEWMEVAGEFHGFYKDENNEAFLNRLAAFLDKYIGKPPEPASASDSASEKH